MFWNVTFIYNAFIRTTDHCKEQIAFVSLFIFLLRWNRETHKIQAYTRAFNEFFTNFFNFGKFVKIREFFFAEVTNSRSMLVVRRRPTAVYQPAYSYSVSLYDHVTLWRVNVSCTFVHYRTVYDCGATNKLLVFYSWRLNGLLSHRVNSRPYVFFTRHLNRALSRPLVSVRWAVKTFVDHSTRQWYPLETVQCAVHNAISRWTIFRPSTAFLLLRHRLRAICFVSLGDRL